MLRVEFGKSQVDSGEVALTGDATTVASAAPLTSTATFDIAPRTHEGIEFVGNFPVVVRLLEAAKADKKKKESVLTEIAHAKFDLLPLLQGSEELNATTAMTTLVPLVDTADGAQPIEVSVNIKTSTPMLSEQQLRECNLLSVTVDGVFSLPETWPVTHPQQPPAATFSLHFPFAESATADRALAMSDGVVVPAPHTPQPRSIKIEVCGGVRVEGEIAESLATWSIHACTCVYASPCVGSSLPALHHAFNLHHTITVTFKSYLQARNL